MAKLLKQYTECNSDAQEWLCDSEADIANIPASAPAGSYAMIITDNDGMIVKMKRNDGTWRKI